MTCFWSGFWEKLDFGGSFGVFWAANWDLVLRVGKGVGWVDGKNFGLWLFEVGNKNFWVVRLLRVVIFWGGFVSLVEKDGLEYLGFFSKLGMGLVGVGVDVCLKRMFELRGRGLLELSKEELRSGFWKIVSSFSGLP
jgi:hypothetical protein